MSRHQHSLLPSQIFPIVSASKEKVLMERRRRVKLMGGICSTSSAHSGGHTVLSSSSSPGSTGPGRSRPVNEPDPGAAAAAAAERRAKNEQSRGVRKDTPKGGALSKKLVETNRAIDQRLPEQKMPERIIWD